MIEIQGNGNIVSREVNVSTFIRLHLACRGQIELHQSDEEKVVIDADENLQDYFSIENSGRTLYVSSDAKFRKPIYTHCVIKVYIRQMDTLYVRNGGANVICPDKISLSQPLDIKVQSEGNTSLYLEVPSIKILCQAQGDVALRGSCEKLEIKNQSEGHFNALHLKAGEVSIKNMAEGNIELYAEKTISIKHFGHGYIHYYGPATVKDVLQYGDGEVKHMKGEPEEEVVGE